MSDSNRDKLLSMMKSRIKNEKGQGKPSHKPISRQRHVEKDAPSLPEGSVVIGLESERAGKQLASLLIPLKLKATVAVNGNDAWEIIKRGVPDCIVVDEGLTFISGIALCEKVRMLPDGLDVPVLLIVNSEDKATKVQAIDSGATSLILKPFAMAELAKKIRLQIK